MKSYKLSAENVTLLAKLLPVVSETCSYDGESLHCPDDLKNEIAAIISSEGWDASGLGFIKDALKATVDTAAEAERLKYITPGNGQAMTYQQKVAEAQAFKATTNQLASDYPTLSSEVGITAETIGEVADVVLTAFAQWQQIGAMIESIRLGAKRDIDAAEDEAAARAIVDAIEWPQPAF
ncbi:hypothetical protein U2P60_14315 [Brucella sp. H1_1004]|uniref:hypothetical protein n=1 Tax=Brucella sp. H1_1004 TaxID=3110109 RepID=UPI0039B53795